MSFRERLIELRKAKGKSQHEVSTELNIINSTYNRWELGQFTPDCNSLCLLADYFNVTTDYLLGRDKVLPMKKRKDSPKDLPNLCYAIGGAYPLLPYEIFLFNGFNTKFFIDGSGNLVCGDECSLTTEDVINIINNRQKIIRIPSFTETEIKMLRSIKELLPSCTNVSRDINGELSVSLGNSSVIISGKALPSLKKGTTICLNDVLNVYKKDSAA